MEKRSHENHYFDVHTTYACWGKPIYKKIGIVCLSRSKVGRNVFFDPGNRRRAATSLSATSVVRPRGQPEMFGCYERRPASDAPSPLIPLFFACPQRYDTNKLTNSDDDTLQMIDTERTTGFCRLIVGHLYDITYRNKDLFTTKFCVFFTETVLWTMVE